MKILYALLPLMLIVASCNEGSDWTDGTAMETAPYFEGVESTALAFTRLGGIGNIQVKTNLSNWGVQSNADWCSVERVSWSNSVVKVTVNENTLKTSRSAQVTITSSEGSASVTISQAEVKPEIVLGSAKAESVARAGESVSVTVNASVDYEVVMEEGCDWISVNESSTDKKVCLDIAQNTNKAARMAIVRFTYTEDNAVYSEFTVSQNGAPYILTTKALTTDRIYSNICEKKEGSISYLTDASTESGFFHSIWSGTGVDKKGNSFTQPDAPHFIVVDMQDTTDVFTFTYSTRGGGRNNGCPSVINIYGSVDFDYDMNWLSSEGALLNPAYTAETAGAALICTFDDLPTSAATAYVGTTSVVDGVKAIRAASAVRYIWIEVAQAKNWENSGALSSSWAMSELKVLPMIQED